MEMVVIDDLFGRTSPRLPGCEAVSQRHTSETVVVAVVVVVVVVVDVVVVVVMLTTAVPIVIDTVITKTMFQSSSS